MAGIRLVGSQATMPQVAPWPFAKINCAEQQLGFVSILRTSNYDGQNPKKSDSTFFGGGLMQKRQVSYLGVFHCA